MSNIKKIAIVGNPNSGKTTIFNFLAKKFEKTGNWSGVTVSIAKGNFKISGKECEVVDLPGIYSVCSCYEDQNIVSFDYNEAKSSVDEMESCKLITLKKIDYIINVVDASNLKRDLYLTIQLLEMGYPIIIVLNRIDNAIKKGIEININEMQRILGAPIILSNARKKDDLKKLEDFLQNSHSKIDEVFFNNFNYEKYYNTIIKNSEPKLIKVLDNFYDDFNKLNTGLKKWEVNRIIEGDKIYYQQDIIDVKKQKKIDQLIEKYVTKSEEKTGESMDMLFLDCRYKFIDNVCDSSIKINYSLFNKVNFNLDNIFLNKWFAIPTLLIVMQIMFIFTLNFGNIFKPIFEDFVQIFIIDFSKIIMEGTLSKFISYNFIEYLEIFIDGVGNGIKTMVSFVPIVWSLYFFMSALEESGYMPRAALIMEMILNKFGLPGKAMIPLIMGFGCNVPAIMAARTIPSKKQRIATIMMLPFMSCSARLVVFTMFCSIFFPENGFYIIMLMYIAGIIIGLGMSYSFRKYLHHSESNIDLHKDYFIMEMPNYHFPRISILIKNANIKAKQFISGIGTTIMIVSICFNLLSLINIHGKIEYKSSNSILAAAAKYITPVFKPMGISSENWEATVGLLSGTLAKEVIVGSVVTLYYNDNALEDIRNHNNNLKNSLGYWYNSVVKFFDFLNIINEDSEEEKDEIDKFGSIVKQKFTSDNAIMSYLFFILLYFPCISVYAVIKKELNRKYAILSATWSTLIAYIGSVIFYQITVLTDTLHLGLLMCSQLFFVTIFIALFLIIFSKFIFKK